MHLISSLPLFFAFALSALALTITSPRSTNQKVDFSNPFTIRWTTVPSDPEKFTITLVNMNGHDVDEDLAVDVDASKEEYTVDNVKNIPIANNYQINFVSTEKNNMGILAQSPMFNVTKVAKEDETAKPTASATRTQSDTAPTETDRNGAGHVNAAFAGSAAMAGMMALVVFAL
ncbi:Ser-Thr-rich glycosyl-phosphatidyl-inositol-anchored membrane family-domain-containing protein [Aspergillus falconensis]